MGGIRLTAYDSGYLLAEALGKYENGKYQDVSDLDETIETVSYTHLDVYKRQVYYLTAKCEWHRYLIYI